MWFLKIIIISDIFIGKFYEFLRNLQGAQE